MCTCIHTVLRLQENSDTMHHTTKGQRQLILTSPSIHPPTVSPHPLVHYPHLEGVGVIVNTDSMQLQSCGFKMSHQGKERNDLLNYCTCRNYCEDYSIGST